MTIVAHTESSVPTFFSTDADFRNFIIGWGAGWDALGWTKTADSGQIDTGTVSKPSSFAQQRGYEIRKNATGTIYVKTVFGSGGDVGAPQMWVSVGYGSDGSGDLTGNSSSVLQLPFYTTSAQSSSMRTSGDDNGLWMAPHITGSEPSSSEHLSIEHPINGAGVAQTDAILLIVSQAGGSLNTQVVPRTGAVPSSTNVITNWFPSQSVGDSGDGIDNGFWHGNVLVNAGCFYTRTHMYKTADIGALSAVDLQFLAGTPKYLTLGGWATTSLGGTGYAWPWAV